MKRKTDRYPGLRSFKSSEAILFQGREREIADLRELIRNEQMVVIHAESGVGKSSLINAGLFKELLELEYLPIKVRFQKSNETPADDEDFCLKIVRDSISKALDRHSQQRTIIFNKVQPRLWEYIKSYEAASSKTFIFIFDQFEELFLCTQDQQQKLLSELSELLHQNPPSRVIEYILKSDTDRSEEFIDWARQPKIKGIFAIRSDKLSHLKDVEPYIPLISFNQRKLNPLQKAEALQAIQKPALIEDPESYSSPVFQYTENVLRDIIEVLTDQFGNIDPTQLQIVCNYIENKVKREVEKGNEISPLLIDRRFIESKEIVSEIIENFYVNQLRKLDDPIRDLAQSAIEESLVSDGIRVSLSKPQMLKLLSEEIINKLIDYRIIRLVHARLGETFELTHDSLILPVEKEKAARRQRENQLAAENTRKELERQRKRNRKWAFAVVALVILSVSLSISFIRLSTTSEILKKSARKGEKLDSLLNNNFSNNRKSQKKSGEYLYGEGVASFRRGDYKSSLTYFANSQFVLSDKDKTKFMHLDTMIALCQTGLKANFLFRVGELDSAISQYTQILNWETKTLTPHNQRVLFPQMQINEAKNAFRVWSDFKEKYQQIHQIDIDLDTISNIIIKGKNLTTLPKEIYRCKNLKRLILDNNKFTQIPPPIFDLKNLQVLYFTNNKLLELSPEVENLKSVVSLGLNNNFISIIPDEIGNLQQLRYLWIQYNNFQILPATVGKLTKLQTIVLSNNSLDGFPAELLNLPSLNNLYLNNTGIAELPEVSLFRNSKLGYMEISCNPIKNIPVLFNRRGNKIRLVTECIDSRQVLPRKDTLLITPIN